MRLRKLVTNIAVTAVLAVAMVIALTPIYWMIISSLKSLDQIYSTKTTWLLTTAHWENYRELLFETGFMRWFVNTVLVTVITVVLGSFLSALGGFAFAKYRFFGQGFLFGMILLSVSVPAFVTIIPIFGWFIRLKLINTYWALILPHSVSALAIFLMRQYIKGIPDEILDSGRTDGLSEFGVFYRIILPLTQPAVAVSSILIFLNTWNDYLFPLVMMRTEEMKVLTVGIAGLKSIFNVNWGMIMAGTTLSTLPVMLMFILMQRQFVEGLTAGALKG